MTATRASTAAPSHALLLWQDERWVYAEIPSTTGQPFVAKFALSEAGLSKALNLLRQRYDEAPTAQKNYTIPPIKPSTRNGKPAVQTAEQRDHALSVLRKMGIV